MLCSRKKPEYYKKQKIPESKIRGEHSNLYNLSVSVTVGGIEPPITKREKNRLCRLFPFYYPINLHHSQTSSGSLSRKEVLLPYKFTPLSNRTMVFNAIVSVLLPYKFTPLSNRLVIWGADGAVLLPYKFTPLSNVTDGTSPTSKVLLPYKFTPLSNAVVNAITLL